MACLTGLSTGAGKRAGQIMQEEVSYGVLQFIMYNIWCMMCGVSWYDITCGVLVTVHCMLDIMVHDMWCCMVYGIRYMGYGVLPPGKPIGGATSTFGYEGSGPDNRARPSLLIKLRPTSKKGSKGKTLPRGLSKVRQEVVDERRQ